MSERDKILTACGWMADAELPLIAERIVNHCINHIKELEAQLDKFRTMYIPSCKHEVRHRINEILGDK